MRKPRTTLLIPPVALGWVRVCREHHERRFGGCMYAPKTGSPYCHEHHFRNWVQTRKANRAKGLCRCGAPVRPGECGPGPNYGQPYSSCEKCYLARRRQAARKQERRRQRAEIERRYRSPNPNAPLSWESPPPPLSPKRQAFVRAYVEHGNASRAAIEAGYCAESTARGGRGASKRGCLLLKRPEIQKAIRERRLEVEAERQANLEKMREAVRERLAREEEQRREDLRDRMILELLELPSAALPQSGASRLIRRFLHHDHRRIPGLCRCGDPVTPGVHRGGKYQDREFSSCASCRDKDRRRMAATRPSRRKVPKRLAHATYPGPHQFLQGAFPSPPA